VKLVIADDHPIVLEGLEALFRGETDIKVVARLLNGEEAVEAVERHRPDILLLDLNMPGMSGIEVLRELAARGLPTRVVLIAAALEPAQVMEALRLGVRGMVLKEMTPRLLVQCVRKVHAGEQWIENRAYGSAMDALLRQSASGQQTDPLTARELELVRLVVTGLRNKDVATKLGIREGTVKTHLHRIYRKLKIESRFELLRYAQSRHLM
jgi:DNA-binding NarL/FixJ family response regulator